MSALENVRRALVIAPHPDDEILGCGGTIARLCAAGVEVHVAIVTRGKPPRFDAAHVRRVEEEARAAHDFLGVTRSHFLDFPAAGLDQVSHAEINGGIGRLVQEIYPETLRSEEHTSELQSQMRIAYAVFCLKKKNKNK